MFRIYQDRKTTDINIGDIEKVVVEDVKGYRQAGFYGRVISVWTTDGEVYSIQLEAGRPEQLTLRDPEPDEIKWGDV